LKHLRRKCHISHEPKFLVIYDTGKNNTEEFLVCENCLDGDYDESFKQYILTKKPLKSDFPKSIGINFDLQEQQN